MYLRFTPQSFCFFFLLPLRRISTSFILLFSKQIHPHPPFLVLTPSHWYPSPEKIYFSLLLFIFLN
jgi:hypothetical protein